MVWGMTLPKGFGDYWPSGEFEKDRKTGDAGWYDRLTSYYASQTPEERKRLYIYTTEPESSTWHYGTYPTYKLKNESGWDDGGSQVSMAVGLEPHELPRSFDTKKTYDSLALLIKLNSKTSAVDEDTKNLTERLEPDVHNFFAFELRMPKGKVYPKQYYILWIKQYFDAFSRDESWSESYEESESNPGFSP